MVNKKTDRRFQILEYIENYWEKHKISPSVLELARAFETSTSVINYHLDVLEDEGLIAYRPTSRSSNIRKSRSIIPKDLARWIEKYFVDESVNKS